MQVVVITSKGIDVYNFPYAFDAAHSHIHYDEYKRKTIYRTLDNPTNDLHGFSPSPESLAKSAEMCDSVYEFPFDYEKRRMLNLDSLNKEQLFLIKDYLKSQIVESKKLLLNK